jgi:hypothetical protein
MGLTVVAGATLRCTMGLTTSKLLEGTGKVFVEGKQAATIEDRCLLKIGTFVMCKADQRPCVPVTATSWQGSCTSINVGGIPLLSSSATVQCARSGTISIADAGQSNMNVESGGVLGALHDGLDAIADLPVPTGPFGPLAGTIDAHVYNLEGNKPQAQAKLRGAVADLVPIKKVKALGRPVLKLLPKRSPKRTTPDVDDDVPGSPGELLERQQRAGDYLVRKRVTEARRQRRREERVGKQLEAMTQNVNSKIAEKSRGADDDDD